MFSEVHIHNYVYLTYEFGDLLIVNYALQYD